jgi:hypothetical protein
MGLATDIEARLGKIFTIVECIAAARARNSRSRAIIPTIDDAHLLSVETLNKFRTMLDFSLKKHKLTHATFTEEASRLILRSSKDTLCAIKNLGIGSLIEAVRDKTRTVDLKQVNAVLMQPHWWHNPRDAPAKPRSNQLETPCQRGARTHHFLTKQKTKTRHQPRQPAKITRSKLDNHQQHPFGI